MKFVKGEDDVKVVRSAYYNFLGHKQRLTNQQVDGFVQKAIDVNCASYVHEILHNHNYLMYYPQKAVLDRLVKHYVDTSNVEGLTEITKILVQSHFL